MSKHKWDRYGGSGKQEVSSIISHGGNAVDLKAISSLNLEKNPAMVGKLLDSSSKRNNFNIQISEAEIISTQSSSNPAINLSWANACFMQVKAEMIADIYSYLMARVLQTHLQFDKQMPEEIKHHLGNYLRDSFNPIKKAYMNHMKNTVDSHQARETAQESFRKRINRFVSACLTNIEAAVRD